MNKLFLVLIENSCEKHVILAKMVNSFDDVKDILENISDYMDYDFTSDEVDECMGALKNDTCWWFGGDSDAFCIELADLA